MLAEHNPRADERNDSAPATDANVVAAPPDPPSRDTAANALQHGLAARKKLPAALQLAVAEHLEVLRCELRPATHVQELLLREMARHAAALDFSQSAEQSALNVGARASSSVEGVLVAGENDDIDATDTALAAAVASQVTERLCRYRRLHERGFYVALQTLRTLQEQRGNHMTAELMDQFRDERNCLEFLRRRIDSAAWRCPQCKNSNVHWIATRERWQCAGCNRQVGLRTGTIMEHSQLPLATWFRAIIVVMSDLSVGPGQLQEQLDIHRLATVRRMLSTIRSALSSPDADRLLAGLNRLAGPNCPLS
jgi:transposase-like protein